MDFMTATFDDILEDANENGNVSYVKSVFKKNPKTPYITFKRAYFQKFYPEEIPVAKPKAKSMLDKLAELE